MLTTADNQQVKDIIWCILNNLNVSINQCKTLSCLFDDEIVLWKYSYSYILPPSQIISRFGFSKFIVFATHLDINIYVDA